MTLERSSGEVFRTGRVLQNRTFRGGAAFRCAGFFWAGELCWSLSRLRRGACGTRHAISDGQNSLRLDTRREDAALYILIYYSCILMEGDGAKVTIALTCFRFDLRVTFGFVWRDAVSFTGHFSEFLPRGLYHHGALVVKKKENAFRKRDL